jgi:hypothetical protein
MPVSEAMTIARQIVDAMDTAHARRRRSRPVVIARRVAWSPDGKSIYAPIAETDADVVVLDGLAR